MAQTPINGKPIMFELDIAWTKSKAFRALQCVFDVMSDIAEDFEYREDVKKAVKACRYLSNHVEVVEHYKGE